MRADPPTIFPSLFDRAPAPVRAFLYSALQLRALQQLYAESSGTGETPLADAVLSNLQISVDITPKDLDNLSLKGPLVVVANHPYGLLDGLVLDAILLRTRPDVKILTNSLLCNLPELRDRTMPVDVLGGRKAIRDNARTMRASMLWLEEGHGVAIFPSGEVSHWSNNDRRITDPPWSDLPVRLARHVRAPIVPVFFEGSNGLAFQLSGLVHPRLRTARLPGELLNKRGREVRVRVGTPIPAADLAKYSDPQQALDYVRARTYVLQYRKKSGAPLPLKPVIFPLLKRQKVEPVALPVPGAAAAEIDQLMAKGKAIIETDTYVLFAEQGYAIPNLVREIGRLRELTFRAVQEGTGKSLDLDRFDPSYTHLVLWHKNNAEVAGAYRLAWTGDVLPQHGIRGLYSATLFRYAPAFFSRLGPAVELGRSFICEEYQKDYAPLLLLFQGIGRSVARRPDSPVLFGAVSISTAYSPVARELIVRFLREHNFHSDLAHYVVPRKPFRTSGLRGSEMGTLAKCLESVEDLSGPIADIGDPSSVPVLLRHYLRLGGRIVGFNVDRHFGDALDGLLVVDLRATSPKLLAKYMGQHESAAFLAAAHPAQSA